MNGIINESKGTLGHVCAHKGQTEQIGGACGHTAR